jgi:predicted lipid carrier protein YhbT
MGHREHDTLAADVPRSPKSDSREETMADATEEFFDELEARGHEPALEKTAGTLRFDLRNGKSVARWLVSIDKGNIAVSRKNAKADCVVRGEKNLFEAIISGKENAMAAVLRGALDIQGDAALLLPFQRLFPAPQRTGR